MRKIYSVVLGLIVAVAGSSTFGQSWEWAVKPIGLAGTNFDNNDVVAVSIDTVGNSYIMGVFNDSATFSTALMKSLAGLDMYIAKLTDAGQLSWVRTIQGYSAADRAFDIETDATGNSIIAGYFADSILVDGTVIRRVGSSATLIAKYGADGTRQWIRVAEGFAVAATGGLALHPSGDFFLATGIMLARYASNGDSVWTRQFIGSGLPLFEDVTASEDGSSVLVTGTFTGTVDFGGTSLIAQSTAGYDIFVTKYTSAGSLVWVRQARGGAGFWFDIGRSVTMDVAGNVYVCGDFDGTALFGTDSISAGSAFLSFFVAKYDASGDVVWVKGGSGGSLTMASALDIRLISNETELMVAADFGATITFDGVTYSISSGGDALLLKMDTAGTVIAGTQSGSALALISVSGMDVDATGTKAVLVGNHSSMQATFTPFVFTTPQATSADGFIVCGMTDFSTPVFERPEDALPSKALLAQNYPNPFNPTTSIEFDVPRRTHVSLIVTNILGQTVRLLANEVLAAGSYTAEWDGTDQKGKPVSAGVYFYRLVLDGQVESKKMTLLK